LVRSRKHFASGFIEGGSGKERERERDSERKLQKVKRKDEK
jgi:hypothetical protein